MEETPKEKVRGRRVQIRKDVRPLALSLAHMDTHTCNTNTPRQTLSCVVSAWLALTSVCAVLNVQRFWVKGGWISVEGPGPFT